jgi:tyrosinase
MADAPVWEAEGGFGGDGSSNLPDTVGEGRCVQDGPFANFEATYFADEHAPHCLSRGFASGSDLERIAAPIAPDALEELRRGAGSFEEYAPELEHRAHTFMRDGVRGDFRAYTGPYGMCPELLLFLSLLRALCLILSSPWRRPCLLPSSCQS